jgi:hypothetical protein
MENKLKNSENFRRPKHLEPHSLPISIRGFWSSKHLQNEHSGGSCDPDLEKSTKEQNPNHSSIELGL